MLGHRTFDFSSDVGVEGDGPTIGDALIELGRAMAQVITDGSPIEARETKAIDLPGAQDLEGTAVAWINELVFLFDTDQFLVSDGALQAVQDPDGIHRVRGTIRGERFDPRRHRAGRGVKAATFHDASHSHEEGRHRFRLVLDL